VRTMWILSMMMIGVAQAQERLAWETAPGTAYELAWDASWEREETTAQWAVDCGLRRAEGEGRRLDAYAASVTLELVATVHSETLAARVTRLSVDVHQHGLRLVAAATGGALTARLEALPGVTWPTPADEARDRAMLDALRAGLEQDARQGVTIDLASDPPRVRGAASLWSACWLQPSTPAPLAAGLSWDAPDAPVLPRSLPAPRARYEVTRLDARQVDLGWDWRHAWDVTDPQGGPGFKILDRDVLRAEATASLDFDRRARCPRRATREARSERTTTSVVNGHLMSRETYREASRSVVTVRR
jgi:hypothetical protein